MRSALALLLLALSPAACGGCGEDEPVTPPPVPKNGEAPVPETFTFRWEGPRPWNDTVYVGTGEMLATSQPFPGRMLGPPGEFVVTAPRGTAYEVRTELILTDAERGMLWHVDSAGVFDTAEPIRIVAPQRSLIRIDGGPHAGPDELVLYDEETGTSGSAIRDETKALFLCAWKGRDGNSYRIRAPARPWVCNEFGAGSRVVAARTRGRQWVVLRAELSPGHEIRVPVGAAPTGGGTVHCDDENALLVLDDEFPIPAPRMAADLTFRATWEGVPPGEHVVRYPDGDEVDITVEDGGEVMLPDR